MLRLERILIPVDLSEFSAAAARHAIALAERFQSEIHILHVLDSGFRMPKLGEEEDEIAPCGPQGREAAQQALDAFLCGELKPGRAKRVLLCGDPASEIVRYAQEIDCSLIAMPTRGYGVLRRCLLGSVTAKVLHDAECPVWTGVHAENFPRIQPATLTKVLCAVDFSSSNTVAVRWAKEFADAYHAQLGLVHVLPVVHESWRPHLERQTRTTLSRMMLIEGVHAETSAEFGEVGEAIAEVARKMGAGLLIIGRGAASAALGRLRSSSYSIIRESPCPVISV